MYFQDMTTAAKTEYLDIRDLGALALFVQRKIGELIDRDGRG